MRRRDDMEDAIASRDRTHEIDLSAGTIASQDTGGRRSTIVLRHGLMMDATLWDEVVDEPSSDWAQALTFGPEPEREAT
jgi:hypothetical protein